MLCKYHLMIDSLITTTFIYHHMAEILLILRKTLSNQSINQSTFTLSPGASPLKPFSFES